MLSQIEQLRYPGEWTEGIVRIGQVSAVNTAAATARVLFDDRDGLVSMELPVLQGSVQGAQAYLLPAVGERVLCLFLGSGVEQGFIVGSFYDDDNPPPESGQVIYLRISDDCFVLINKATKQIVVSTSGEVSITAAGGVSIVGDVNVTGTVTASVDVTAAGISLVGHIHFDPGDNTFVDPPQ